MRARPDVRRAGGVASCFLAFVLTPDVAFAVEYEAFVDARSEEELHELFEQGVLDDEALETLLDLHRAPLDLDAAPRDRLYALPNLSFAEVDAIVAHRETHGSITLEALEEDEVLPSRKVRALAAFVRAPDRRSDRPHAEVRTTTHHLLTDPRPPASVLAGRAWGFRGLEVGVVAMTVRERPGSPSFDPSRDALVAEMPRYGVTVPRYALSYSNARWNVVLGTYRAGFAEGLTFDTLGFARPDGFRPDLTFVRPRELTRRCRLGRGELDASPCDGARGTMYGGPDFAAREGLRGVGVSYRSRRRRGRAIEAHLFASHERHSLYQYQLRDAALCPDAQAGGTECRAPEIYVATDGPAARHAFRTLPAAFDLRTLGGRAALRTRSLTLGVTGYGASPRFLVPDVALDFQRWSRWPHGGSFGATGVDASLGLGAWELRGEVTRSFDAMPTGGGWGAIVRALGSVSSGELELSLRSYDPEFANPFARPIAAPDTLDGLRARDEMGARFRYVGWPRGGIARLSILQDLWRVRTLDVIRMRSFVRADVEVLRPLRLSAWFDRTDKDLRRRGRGGCFEGESPDGQDGAPLACGGEKLRVAGRAQLLASKAIHLTMQHQRTWIDDRVYERRFRRDAASEVGLRFLPRRALRFRIRARHVFFDTSNRARLERSLRALFETSVRFGTGQWLRVRYELLAWLDTRESTLVRGPSPAHWFWLETSVRF